LPQHWSQTAKDHKPNNRGTWLGTYHDCIELWWNQCQYKCTVPLDPNEMNIGTITTAPGYTRYHAFATEMDKPKGEGYDKDLTYEPRVVSDDEDDSWVDQHENKIRALGAQAADFNLDGPKQSRDMEDVDVDEVDHIPQDASAKFLRWHH